jgi:hypothetical protein
MSTTHPDGHGYPATETREVGAEESQHPPALHKPHVSRSVKLQWGALLLGGIALWWLAMLGLGRLTGWW